MKYDTDNARQGRKQISLIPLHAFDSLHGSYRHQTILMMHGPMAIFILLCIVTRAFAGLGEVWAEGATSRQSKTILFDDDECMYLPSGIWTLPGPSSSRITLFFPAVKPSATYLILHSLDCVVAIVGQKRLQDMGRPVDRLVAQAVPTRLPAESRFPRGWRHVRPAHSPLRG